MGLVVGVDADQTAGEIHEGAEHSAVDQPLGIVLIFTGRHARLDRAGRPFDDLEPLRRVKAAGVLGGGQGGAGVGHAVFSKSATRIATLSILFTLVSGKAPSQKVTRLGHL